MNLLEKLDEEKIKIVNEIKKNALAQNVNAYIVGGVVRDLILGHKITDIDFVVDKSAIEFAKKSGFKIKSIHEDFDTIKVLIENAEIDIATTRIETYENKKALADIVKTGVKIEQDLKRRDFSINAIAINILDNSIVDLYDGKKDIERGILRILHKKSFIDDPTRILRGLDFKYRFNFDFDFDTKNLIIEYLQNPNYQNISYDRIYLTLNKIFSKPYSNKILEEIIDKKIYKIWLEFSDIKKDAVEKLDFCVRVFNIKEKSKLYIKAFEPYSAPDIKFENEFEIYKFFKTFDNFNLALFYFKTENKSAIDYLKIKDIKLNITGKTLKEMGFLEGKIIGEILNCTLKEKILNPAKFSNIEDEINFVKNNFSL